MVNIMRTDTSIKFAEAATRGRRDWCASAYAHQPTNPEAPAE